jgi:hypothetical protein
MDSSLHFRISCSIALKHLHKNGTTSVNPTAASSVFENPVTFFPLTKILRLLLRFSLLVSDIQKLLVCYCKKEVIKLLESSLDAKSHNGPDLLDKIQHHNQTLLRQLIYVFYLI